MSGHSVLNELAVSEKELPVVGAAYQMVANLLDKMDQNGYNAEKAYTESVSPIKEKQRPSFGNVSKLALGIMHAHEQDAHNDIFLMNLGRAYAALGDTGGAQKIALDFLSKSPEYRKGEPYFGLASCIFDSLGFGPERVVDLIGSGFPSPRDREVRNVYVKRVVHNYKEKMLKALKKDKKKILWSDYRGDLKPIMRKMQTTNREKEEIEREMKKISGNMTGKEEERTELGKKTYRLIDSKRFTDDKKIYDGLSLEIANLKSKVDKLSEEFNVESFHYGELITEMEILRNYHRGRIIERVRGAKNRIQSFAHQLGYNVDLFPAWAESIRKGNINTKTKEGKRILRKNAMSYIKNRDFENAHSIFETIGDGRQTSRLDRYLEKAGHDQKEACRMFAEKHIKE